MFFFVCEYYLEYFCKCIGEIMKIIILFLLVMITASTAFAEAATPSSKETLNTDYEVKVLTPKQQCEANGINYKQALNFVIQFQDALKKDDREKVATLFSYPIRVYKEKTTFYIKSKQEFLQKYPAIFHKNMKAGLMGDSEIFCNSQGASIGGGWLWFDTSKAGITIIAINVPGIAN